MPKDSMSGPTQNSASKISADTAEGSPGLADLLLEDVSIDGMCGVY